jgi:hypothetical protein
LGREEESENCEGKKKKKLGKGSRKFGREESGR